MKLEREVDLQTHKNTTQLTKCKKTSKVQHLFIYFYRTESEMKTAELNRNWSLLFFQLSWISLQEIAADGVPSAICQVFGAITHFLWLSSFIWTGKYTGM